VFRLLVSTFKPYKAEILTWLMKKDPTSWIKSGGTVATFLASPNLRFFKRGGDASRPDTISTFSNDLVLVSPFLKSRQESHDGITTLA